MVEVTSSRPPASVPSTAATTSLLRLALRIYRIDALRDLEHGIGSKLARVGKRQAGRQGQLA